MRTQIPTASIFFTLACAFGLLILQPSVSHADSGRCEVAAIGTEAQPTFKGLIEQATAEPVRVADVEYRIIKEMMVNTDFILKFSGQVATTRMAYDLVPKFEQLYGPLENVDPQILVRDFDLSQKQATVILEILVDMKSLAADTKKTVYLPPKVMETLSHYAHYYNLIRNNKSRLSRTTDFVLFSGTVRSYKKTYEAHLRRAELDGQNTLRPLNQNVERSWMKWNQQLLADAQLTPKDRFHLGAASDRIETTSSLITAINHVEAGNGQSYDQALVDYTKADDGQKEKLEKEMVSGIDRKSQQLKLAIKRLELLRADLDAPADPSEAVDEADHVLDLKIRAQWEPLIMFLQETAALKMAVLQVQRQNIANGFTKELLESNASRKALRSLQNQR